ncbi:Transcriptional regulator, XRE family [Acidobacteriia bacterium SbA2]|nr:Transcriptional regulator, XRE family [Acidobacteriia bacterium SbA2]
MSTLAVNNNYGDLLRRLSPKVIRTEKENDAYTEVLYDLDQRSQDLTPAERELAELLTLLIEDFEERHYRLPRAKPLDVLHFLMDQHGLKQKDLVDVFGTASVVSEILNGKRELNKGQIERLSERFRVSPELFF